MEQLSILRKHIQGYFLSIFLFLVAFSFSYIPILFLPLSSTYLLVASVIILFMVLLYNKTSFKELFNDYSIFFWYSIFLIWYSIRLLTAASTQLILVNFESVYFVNSIVIFLCINFRHLKDYVSKVIFFLSSIYFIIGITAYSSFLTNEVTGFFNIFELFELDFEGQIYQNVGFWISLLSICFFNYIIIYFKSFKENKLIFIGLILSFLLSIIFLLLSGARGSLLGLMIALIYLSRNIRDKRFIFSSIFVILLFLIFMLLNQEIFLTINRFLILFSGDESSRIYLFSQAIKLWSQDISTILFGAGVKSFPIFIYQNDFGYYPHNVFLEILCELGLIGLIIFLRILFLFFKHRGDNELINTFSIFLICLFCFSDSFDSFYKVFFFLCLGIKNINKEYLIR